MSNPARRFLEKAHAMCQRHRGEFDKLCTEFSADLLATSGKDHFHLVLDQPATVVLDESQNDKVITGLAVGTLSVAVRDGRPDARIGFVGAADGMEGPLSQIVPGTFYELLNEIEKALLGDELKAMRDEPLREEAPRPVVWLAGDQAVANSLGFGVYDGQVKRVTDPSEGDVYFASDDDAIAWVRENQRIRVCSKAFKICNLS